MSTHLFGSTIVTHRDQCKGLMFRYKETRALTLRGGWKTVSEVYPLKRLSCPGCHACGDLMQVVRDNPDDVEFDPALQHGDFCGIEVVVDSHDCETGVADDWHARFVPLFYNINGPLRTDPRGIL